jgi:hypothetical protein
MRAPFAEPDHEDGPPQTVEGATHRELAVRPVARALPFADRAREPLEVALERQLVAGAARRA